MCLCARTWSPAWDRAQCVRFFACWDLAVQAGDTCSGNDEVVALWREVLRPRKLGVVHPQPLDYEDRVELLFDAWLLKRGLIHLLSWTPDRGEQGGTGSTYQRRGGNSVLHGHHLQTSYYDTWWYSWWSTLVRGVLLVSYVHFLGLGFPTLAHWMGVRRTSHVGWRWLAVIIRDDLLDAAALVGNGSWVPLSTPGYPVL